MPNRIQLEFARNFIIGISGPLNVVGHLLQVRVKIIGFDGVPDSVVKVAISAEKVWHIVVLGNLVSFPLLVPVIAMFFSQRGAILG
ncbi:hypothetical protein D3C72_2397680 [compost metagenome]